MKRMTKFVVGLALAVVIASVLWMALQRNKGPGAVQPVMYTQTPTPTFLPAQAARGPEYSDRLTGTPVLGPQLTGTPAPNFDMLGYADPDDDDYGII